MATMSNGAALLRDVVDFDYPAKNKLTLMLPLGAGDLEYCNEAAVILDSFEAEIQGSGHRQSRTADEAQVECGNAMGSSADDPFPPPSGASHQKISDGTQDWPTSLSRRRCLAPTISASTDLHSGNSMITVGTTSTDHLLATKGKEDIALGKNMSGWIEEEKEEEGIPGQAGGIRASLDAGMARVRRWIRARPPNRTRAPESNIADHPFRDVSSRGMESIGNSNSRNSEEDDSDSIFVTTSPQLEEGDSGPTLRHLNGQTETKAAAESLVQTSRQRALSEPDGARIRNILFQRAVQRGQRGVRRRHLPPTGDRPQLLRHFSPRDRGNSVELVAFPSSQMSTSGDEVVYASIVPRASTDGGFEGIESVEARNLDMAGNPVHGGDGRIHSSSMIEIESPISSDGGPDLHRLARNRWITINRRFQYVIRIVALVFSLLLFGILVCWVVLTSAYVVSIDKTCDVPLKYYYWFVTLQLIVDVFRIEIMRFFFRWDANSNQRIPCRVITYNVAYLTYALLVLRMGVVSVALDKESSCPSTAPELFQASLAFVSLSITAWGTIIFGYFVPFCVVAVLLTWNGYTPVSLQNEGGPTSPFTVFPAVMGAPPGLVDEMPLVIPENFPSHYPMECCICMENFTGNDVIVKTGCQHVFHKQCCRDWLRQARTCPVCRSDVPSFLEGAEHRDQHQRRESRGRIGFGRGTSTFVGRNDIHHEVVSLLQILRRRERTRNPIASTVARPADS